MAETYTGRTLREIVRILARRFLGMAVIFIVTLAAVAAGTYLAPKWYRSEVPLLAKPGIVGSPLEEQVSLLRDKVSLFVVTQREIVTSDYVLASALMKLQGKPRQTPTTAEAEPTAWYADAQVGNCVRVNSKLMDRLRKRVKVVTPGGPDATFTQVFKVRVDWSQSDDRLMTGGGSPSPAAARAAELAGAVKDAYLMRYSCLESQRAREATRMLRQDALGLAKANLDESFTAFQQFVEQELKGDLLQVINMVGGRAVGAETGDASLATRFRGEINKIDERLAEVTTLKAAVDAELAKAETEPPVIPDAITAANPVIAKLQSKIVETKLNLNSLQPRYTEDYQELQHAKAELAAAQADLRGELSKQSGRLAQEMAVLNARRATLREKVVEDRKRVDELASKVARYQRLQKAVESAQLLHDEEQRRVMNSVTAEKLAASPILVTVLGDAFRPEAAEPRRPILWLNMLIAVVAGMILSLVYAFLADHLDHSIKSIDNAERYLGAPVLASVPKLGGAIIRRR
jgi:uncharacterized protein involved in exopolysaccharide biosynthesis